MCPELFHIGDFAVRAYGLTLALSFLVGLSLIRREARHLGLDPEALVNLGFVLIIFGVLGGRLGYVLYHLSDFADRPLDVINPFQSGQLGIAGLNLQGGMIGGFLAGLIYLRLKSLPLAASLDAVVPAVGFGIFLSRIGCYLNGCCFGTSTEGPFGVHFPVSSPAHAIFGASAVHPTQLYSSAYGLLLFLGLMWVNRHWYRIGRSVGLFFVAEAAFRLLIEPLRYYEEAMWLQIAGVGITYNVLAGALMFLIGLYFLLKGSPDRGKTA
jgi:phosphatidylglycerol:prolipoprotein diacylglycerol transferase